LLGGVLLQQGECTLLKPLKIEFGEVYSRNKKKLIFALDSGGGSEISEFSDDLGCAPPARELFKKDLIMNKTQIFGEFFEKSSRQITLNIYDMIRRDPELNKACWY